MKKDDKEKIKKTSLVPLGNRLLVVPPSEEEASKTDSGIILTGKIDFKNEGIVTAVGKEVKEKIGVGDRVIYSPYGYEEVQVDGKKVLIIREDNILATYV